VRADSKGRPNAKRDADLDERCPDERRRSRNQAERNAMRPQGESRQKRGDDSYHNPCKPG